MRPSASIVMPWRQESQAIFDDTITMLRKLTPPDFLDTYSWMMTEITQRNKKRLNWWCRSLGYREGKSFLKVSSHFGAMDLPTWWTGTDLLYHCLICDSWFVDPGNLVYKDFAKQAWPLSQSSHGKQEMVGDLVESLLSWRWRLRCGVIPNFPRLSVQVLELVNVACIHMARLHMHT